MVRFHRNAALVYTLMMAACTPPPPPDIGTVSNVCEPLVRGPSTREFAGSGDAALSVEGDVHHGNIDVIADGKGTVRAHFYGALGIIVASVTADAGSGSVSFDDQTYAFTADQTMDTLPFSWGRDLAFSDLVSLLQGRLPYGFAAVMRRPPDSMDVRRTTIKLLWQTDMVQITAAIKRRSSALCWIMAGMSGQPSWTLKMGRFRKEKPYKIELREDDRNYFLITFEKIR
ncbi:MAG: hypothetical protein JW768_13270 [Chitinispirillaceae bacterium]|nr:hypothetical protein [Chitinispirillaceae bacterium]